MSYTDQLADIELSNRIYSCKSRKRAYERELIEVEFRYHGIPTKRTGVTHSLYKTGIASILLSIFLIYCIKILVPIFAGIITTGSSSPGDGILIILIMPGTLLGIIACYLLWRRTLQLKVYLLGLEREEPYLENRIQSIKKQMNDLDNELFELLERKKQKSKEFSNV